MVRGNFLPVVATALLLIIITGIILFKPSFQKSSIFSPTPIPTISGPSLPPFYEQIVWNSEVQTEIAVFTEKGGSAQTIEGWRITSHTLTKWPKNLVDYYRNELRARGWEFVEIVDDTREFYKSGQGKYFSFSVLASGQPETYIVILEYTR